LAPALNPAAPPFAAFAPPAAANPAPAPAPLVSATARSNSEAELSSSSSNSLFKDSSLQNTAQNNKAKIIY
jgi:hypothetical protein